MGEVLFHQGQMVKARLGGARGQTALLRLLAISEGNFGVDSCSVSEELPIVPNVSHLIELHSAREAEWKTLCGNAPPLSSILRLTAGGADVRDSSRGIQRVILALIDGHRTLMQILEESSFDPVEALKIVTKALDDDLAQISPQATSLFPLATAGDDSGVLPRFTNLHMTPVQKSPSAVTDLSPPSWRHSTLVGIGVKVRSELPTGLATPIIEVGGNSPAGMGTEGSRVKTVIQGFGSNPVSTAPRDNQSGGAPRQRIVDVTSADSGYVTTKPNIAAPSQSEAPVAQGPSNSANSQRRFVDRYEILLRIGRGGMGTVYLARLSSAEVGFRRLYALKLLRSHLSQDAQASKDFLDEARVAGCLHHPNIVSVYDAGFHGKQPYLVMEYVEGCSLKQLTRGLASRPPYLLLPIIMDALAGLHAAHTLQDESGTDLHLVHCDVSPENMLVGVNGICRLTDFGMARKASRLLGDTTRGKAAYVAPERITGKAFDHRTDIYSMGVVLWDALTGKRLFAGETTEETIAQVCRKPIDPPSAQGAQSSPALDGIVMRALSRNPNDRFDSAEEMLSELGRVAANHGGLATPKEIASWVREAAGSELTQQRLAILDASRNNPTIPPPASLPQPTEASAASTMSPGEVSPSSETGVTSFFYGVEEYASRLAPSQGLASVREATKSRRHSTRLATWLKKPWMLVVWLAVLVALVLFILLQTRPQRSAVGSDTNHRSVPNR